MVREGSRWWRPSGRWLSTRLTGKVKEASTRALAAKAVHSRAPWITEQLSPQPFIAPFTPVLWDTGWQKAPSAWVKGRSRALGVFSFLLGRSLCLLLGCLLRGNNSKAWLRGQTSPLCTKQTLHGFTLPICLHHKHSLVCLGSSAGREGRWPRVATAWVGALVSRPREFYVACVGCLGLCWLLSLCVFRWLDGLVTVVGVWWFRLADEESGVWRSGQHPVCGEQHAAPRLQRNTWWVSSQSHAVHEQPPSQQVRPTKFRGDDLCETFATLDRAKFSTFSVMLLVRLILDIFPERQPVFY